MFLVRPPSRDLAGVVEFCWSAAATAGSGTALRQLFPGSATDLVLRLSPHGCRMALLGPATRAAAVETHGPSHYLGIRFRTGQTPLVADIRPRELVDSREILDSLAGERVDSLADRLLSLADHAARQRVLEDALRGLRPMVEDERVRRAALLLDRHGGRPRVAELAQGMGLAPRSLERLFALHLGLPPKRVARLARVKTVLALLRDGGFGSLADLALRCGYADQPHMTNDFRRLTGRLPSEIDAGFTGLVQAPPEGGAVHRYLP